MRIQLAPEAVDDLTAAIEYLHERNPRAAVAMSAAVFDAIEKLAGNAFEGPESQLRTTGEHVRSWPVRPYRIYYRREPEMFVVLRIHHGAQRPITR